MRWRGRAVVVAVAGLLVAAAVVLPTTQAVFSAGTDPTWVAGTAWYSLSLGHAHTCAIQADTSLWCWGFNGTGQLGLSDTTDRAVPTQVPGVRTAYVAATWFSTYATQFTS